MADTTFADGGVRTVAFTGQHAPGMGPDVVISTLGYPSLNAHGQVAFASTLAGTGIDNLNGDTIWLDSTGSDLELLARSGEQAPDAPAGMLFFHAFDFLYPSPQLNDAGDVGGAFRLYDSLNPTLINPDHGTRNFGYWLRRPGEGLTNVVLGGEQTPEFNHFFRGFGFYSINNLGQHVHGAVPLPIPAGDIADAIPTESLWLLGPDDAPRLIAGRGNPAPGLPSGVVFLNDGNDLSEVSDALLNDVGQVAFKMRVSGPGVNSSNDLGYWIWEPLGGAKLIIRERDQAPGLPSGVTVDFSVFGGLTEFNDAGQVMLYGLLQGTGVNSNNNAGTWLTNADGDLELLVREGTVAPGTSTNSVFAVVGQFALNNAGQAAVEWSLRGTGIGNNNRSGIWSHSGDGALELLVREGDPAPDTADGVVFDDSLDLEVPIFADALSLNDSGQHAFSANVRGPGVTTANNFGVWAQDRAGAWRLIVRTGEMLDVDDGPGIDMRTVQDILLGGDFLNDRGQVAFHARFTDGSRGIFISNVVAVPEPSSVGLIAICLLAKLGLRPPASKYGSGTAASGCK
jgi:hypothetical protein